MDGITLALVGLAGMFILILMHVPIGVAMAFAGLIGFGSMAGFKPALSLLASETAATLSNLDLATIPLFVLMGGIAHAAGLSEDLYRLAYALVGHRRGGLAFATLMGCAGFGAVCGSSLATTATFGKIALPQMFARRYEPGLASATVAAGGTLGILVPPSVVMVIYAVLTEQLIITLYVAAIIPAVIAILLYAVSVSLYVRTRPHAAPAGPRLSWRERLVAARRGWPVLAVIGAVLGGMSFGIFTATEGAAVGAALAFLCGVARGKLTWSAIRDAFTDTASTTAMIYVIILGATLFGYFVALTHAPEIIVRTIQETGVSGPIVLVLLMVMYLILGAVFDELATMVITLPFVLPVIAGLGYDPVWWGIINVVICELGQLIPPIGINVLVIHGVAPQVPLGAIYRGVMPYIAADVVRLATLIAFPTLTLWLPKLLAS